MLERIAVMDECSFVIRHCSVALTSDSVRTVPQYKYCTCDQVDSIWKNLLDRVSGCTSLFSLPERLKADNTIRVNHHGALDLGSTRYMKNEGTVRVLEGTARRYCSKVLLLFESTAHYAQSTARCESTAVMFEGTASFIREGKIIMARIWRFIEEVIMRKIEYCLFDVVVEFHREMITSQLQGKLRLYDEVRARTLFVLSSSNRGRLVSEHD
ncbi:hypothetical protein Tco_0420818 [Tanacetum coccineum]